MLNIPELEQKWIRYKIKSFIPYIVSGVTAILILILIIVFYPSKALESKPKTPAAIVQKPATEENNTLPKQIEVSKVAIQSIPMNEVNATKQDERNDDQKLVLKPSLNFVNEIGDSMVTYYDDKTVKPQTTKPKPVQKQEIKVPIKQKPNKVEEQPQNEITIKTKKVDNDLQEVIRRFKKTNNPVLSLFLAKKYYEMKKYNQSYNYALITNQLDSSIEMSWIIFAKSLVKLGQKDMAINTLKSYIKNSNSQTAAALLDEIQSGRFQ